MKESNIEDAKLQEQINFGRKEEAYKIALELFHNFVEQKMMENVGVYLTSESIESILDDYSLLLDKLFQDKNFFNECIDYVYKLADERTRIETIYWFISIVAIFGWPESELSDEFNKCMQFYNKLFKNVKFFDSAGLLSYFYLLEWTSPHFTLKISHVLDDRKNTLTWKNKIERAKKYFGRDYYPGSFREKNSQVEDYKKDNVKN